MHDGQGEFRGLRSRRRNRWLVYLGIFGGWLVTFAIVVALFMCLVFYSEVVPIMSQMTKREVNAIITGLSIALSVSVLKGLNDFVFTLRWWILSRHYHSLRKVDLILQAESVSCIIRLAARTSRLSVHGAALVWLCLILAVQIALALLGLCYSVELHDSLAMIIKEGNVSIPSMSSIQTVKLVQSDTDSLKSQEYTANKFVLCFFPQALPSFSRKLALTNSSFGQISLAFDTKPIGIIPAVGSIWTAAEPLMFCDDKHCAYVFHETSAVSTEDNSNDGDDDISQMRNLIVTTDRTINSTAVCYSWPVISGGNGTETSIRIDAKGDGTAEEVFIPIRGGVNQTTYMTNTTESCGAGCRTVAAFEAAEDKSWYYRCNVTVSQVGNAARPEHEVSEGLRSMAAAAISLQGIEVSSFDTDDVQYQVYPAESFFGLPKLGFNDSMAATMARFAIGTVAICAQFNEALVVDGFAPVKGSHLVVDHWDYASLILSSVTLGQLVLGIATAILASLVVVPEGGPIAMSRVLSPITRKLQNSGKGDLLLASEGQGSLWIYKAVKTAEEGIYDLFMEEKIRPENRTEDIEMF
ncbi:hypothetical protein CH63R_06158 [Colletotrichum higginsianum IMI 349063]|uniref:Uncharacterized protein n=1 Tax=Colletotrichum higginsianum (strain IMI 349063) TaxID=759273 RepID=A0A1B7YEI5_COLHI|nr:hypothetical protein CH63R_06158 [Colletotrichum higginsianum IMI 349063]OBR10466.1 hypothetical protein CH63R_06158 [Colletotrichum higginsianum IMI 349063]